jgi:hypothetical protein
MLYPTEKTVEAAAASLAAILTAVSLKANETVTAVAGIPEAVNVTL